MNIAPRKKWGQNFLIDPNIIHKIISIIEPYKKHQILEIGPGKGALTKPLSMICKKITAIEIDPLLCDYLNNLKLKNVDIHNEDILKFDCNKLPKNYVIIGNLPYNISTPILFKFINDNNWRKLIIMIQKEVAERIISSENNKKYGRISVMMQSFFNINLEFNIPKTVFSPRPEITSSLLTITPKKNISTNYDNLKLLVQNAFKHRRKKLRHNLNTILNDEIIFPIKDKRAEQLSVQEYQILAKHVK